MSSCPGQWDTSGLWTHLTGAVGVQSQPGHVDGAEYDASLEKQMLKKGKFEVFTQKTWLLNEAG